MHFVFFTIAALGLIYFFCKSRRFDYLAILFFSGLVYALHAFVGHVECHKSYGYFYIEVSQYAYTTLSVYFGTILIGTLFYDFHIASPDHSDYDAPSDRLLQSYKHCAIALNLLSAVFCFSFLRESPDIILHSINKLEFLEELGRSHTLFQLSAVMGLVASVLARKKSLILVATSLLLLDVYIGFRSGFAMAAIGVIMVLAERNKPAPLYQKWKLVAFGGAIATFTLVIKRFYRAIKSGDNFILEYSYDFVVNRPKEMILNSEPQGVMLMYLASLENEIRVDFQYVLNQLIGLIPLGPMLGFHAEENFNDVVQGSVLGVSSDRVGLAASSLGEWHAIGGHAGLVALGVLLIVAIACLSKLRHRAAWLHPPCTAILSFYSFYSYRNGIFQTAKFSRNVILLSVVVVALAFLVKAFMGLQSQQKRPFQPSGRRRQHN